MFKVECLGCQAPYQVDEKRVPDNGLKMRCPKCGTSFKVEPPAQAGAPRPVAAELDGSDGAGAPASASRPLASTGFEASKGGPGKPPGVGGGRDPLARTMIGVSAQNVGLAENPGPGEPGRPKAFRIPRPGGAAPPAPAVSLERAASSSGGAPLSEPDLPALAGEQRFALAAASTGGFESPDADLPVLIGAPRPTAWVVPSEAPPESLAEPSAPLRLSELPPPVAAPAGSQAPLPFSKPPSVEQPPLELDFGDDLPVAAAAGKKPPPRRPRAGVGAEPATGPDQVDLPARIEDLEAALPQAAPAGQALPAGRRAPARQKSSSLDEVDLPAILERQNSADLPAPRRAPPEPQVPAAAARALGASRPEAADLPAIGAGRRARPARPGVADLPDVARAALPDVARAALPDVAAGLPDLARAGLPDVRAAGLPAVAAGLPDVARAGLPQVVAAGLPEVAGAGLPEVVPAGLPNLSDTGLPEVTGRGVGGFGRIDLPVAREAGLPEVRAPGIGPADLPSVGEALPALAGESWGDEHLPTVGGHASNGDLFGDFGPASEGDPFAGSEADFGTTEDLGDPFGVPEPPDDADVPPPASGASYGEVDIGGGVSSGAPLETEEMEFGAVPQRSSSPAGRAAAHASVHDAADAETAGSTLELGPERRKVPRRYSKRLAVALAVCASAIAGGALALEPRLGPFGIHFILDRVHRAEHEQLLSRLVADGRQSAAQDTLAAATAALARLEAARQRAPRFEPLQARSVFAHYAVALRFGPLPKLEATAKALSERLDPESMAPGHRLARAVRAIAERSPEGRRQLEALGSDPDARQLLGEAALRDRDWPAAAAIWGEIGKADAQNAAAAFGLARAEFGLDKLAEARATAQRVLTTSPEHVGARILLLEAQRAQGEAGVKAGPHDLGSEALVANLQQALPHASPGEAALAHSVLGEVHMAQGRTAPAQKQFEEALAIDRNFARALIGLGETLELGGRHAEALARFEAAVHAQPDSLPAELGMAKCLIQLQRLPEADVILKRRLEKQPDHAALLYWRGRSEQAAGDSEAALGAYRAAVEAGKGRADSAEAYLALAKLQAELGQLAVAQATLADAQEKLPPSGALNKALGEIAMSRAEYTQAYGYFQRALELDSGDTRARFLGAVTLTRLGRFEEALSAFDSVGQSDKDFPGLAVERGRLFEESGKNEQALKEYEAALLLSPEDPDVQVRVGCSRVVAARGAEAVPLLEKALKARPRSAEANHCLGRALFDEGRLIEALQRLERAASLDATRAVYPLYVAWVSAELGRLADASVALERALDLDKGLADAYWQRGRLRQRQGAVKDAIRDLEQALKLKPSRYEALADLASAYADLGRLPASLRTWEEAIARDADNPTWHFRYGKLLSSSGSGAMAAAHLRRAIDLVNEAKAAATGKTKAPVWLWQAHYLLARELGQVAAAIAHWQAYLRLSPAEDPYRREAERALAALGQPWDPG